MPGLRARYELRQRLQSSKHSGSKTSWPRSFLVSRSHRPRSLSSEKGDAHSSSKHDPQPPRYTILRAARSSANDHCRLRWRHLLQTGISLHRKRHADIPSVVLRTGLSSPCRRDALIPLNRGRSDAHQNLAVEPAPPAGRAIEAAFERL